MKEPKIRKIVTNLEEVFYEGGAEKPVETNSGRKSIKTVSVAAVIKNPYAGQWVEDLSELTEYGEYLGDLLTKKGAELLGAENVETYGKGCIVGLDGELEHSSAMLHPKSGKTIRAAIDSGYKSAMSAIIDSNVTTIIAAVVLWKLGTGTTVGFAKTLFIGVILSMIVMLFASQIMMKALVGVKATNPALYGVKKNKEEK